MPTYRSDQAAIHLSVSGLTIDNVSWESFDGGDLTTDSTPHMPGGMAPQIELGGIPKRSPITLKRAWSDTLINVFKKLDAAAGDTPCAVGVSTLDVNKRVVDTIPYTGVLLDVSRPPYDATQSNPGFLTVRIGANRSLGS